MKTETRVGIFVIIAIGIFFYLSFNIGAFRLDEDQYYIYKTYFDDTGGLDTKAPVKVAGVEVGWVDAIKLLQGGKAEVTIRVHKKNRLAKNAYAVIQQEGLIGTKTLEIDPGDPSTGMMLPGSVLSLPGKSPATVSDLLDQFRDIAGSIHDIALSFRNVFASRQGEEDMRSTLRNASKAADKISHVGEVLHRSLSKNEKNLDSTFENLEKTMGHLEYSVPQITDDFHGVSGSFKDELVPNFTKNFDKVSLALAEDTLPKLSKLSLKGHDALESFGGASDQAEGVLSKINEGKGLLGKLITEDETYDDIKGTIRGIKNYVSKASNLNVYVDMHSETLFKTTVSKGYFEVLLRTAHDYFYVIQLVADENGYIARHDVHREFRDKDGTILPVELLTEDPHHQLNNAQQIRYQTRHRNALLFGFQFGKRFNRVALRIGLFEGTAGAAIDFYVPLNMDKFHWITSLEMYDMRGIRRFDDARPHLKWANKTFFMKNMYTAFGIDDFYSKKSASPYFGGGFRFGDDDLKYVLSMLPLGAIGAQR